MYSSSLQSSLSGFLWVMWLAAAGFTVASISELLDLCSVNPGISNLQGACRNSQAAAAFGFLSWLARMFRPFTLIFLY